MSQRKLSLRIKRRRLFKQKKIPLKIAGDEIIFYHQIST
jgi:hypothetical protein